MIEVEAEILNTSQRKTNRNSLAYTKNEKHNSIMMSSSSGRFSSISRDMKKSTKDAPIVSVNLSLPIDEDPLENGMRIAYERELQFKVCIECLTYFSI